MSKLFYTLRRSRRAKRISIVLCRDAVLVVAPMKVGRDVINSFVESHSEWIRSRTEEIKRRRADWLRPEDMKQEHFLAARGRAKKFVMERLKIYAPLYAVFYRRVSIKNMKTRWGSCSGEKNLNFHYRLVFLPLELADYVVVHELCHLEHLNHSQQFWNLVAETIPDYRPRRAELKRYGLGV
ncbi:MAG: M48 family metallopeptidase [Candidatus Magasanikbacteria bacterium]|nr:M48 family metallopeptidase [Candidatus Magasanikbacteria bacterium]